MNAIDCLRRMGYATLSPGVYKQITLWGQWYEGEVPAVHRYRVSTGKGCSARKRRLSMGMARQAAADLGGLLMSEQVQITVDDEQANNFVQEVLTRAHFVSDGAAWQERKAALGTIAYVPFFRDATIDSEGRITAGTVDIAYIAAEDIFPLSWQGSEITECAFVTTQVCKGKTYKIFSIHEKEDGGTYKITQRIFLDSGTGREISPEERALIPGLSELCPEIYTGDTKPQFVIDRLNITNPDKDNPLGVAVYAGALDVLTKLDLEYDSYKAEFELGRKRLFVAPELLSGQDQAFDPADVLFYQLPEGYFQDTKEALHESNPALRTAEHSQAIDDDLRYFSALCGFGATHYRYSTAGVATATQVISENSDLFRTVRKHEQKLEHAITELVHIIIRLGNVIGLGLDENAEITIRFDDSIIEDKQAERAQDLQDLAARVMSPAEYRAKWYGETLEQAQAAIEGGAGTDTVIE